MLVSVDDIELDQHVRTVWRTINDLADWLNSDIADEVLKVQLARTLERLIDGGSELGRLYDVFIASRT
jgi:hypothetical protein